MQMYKQCVCKQKYFSEKHTNISENILDKTFYSLIAQY